MNIEISNTPMDQRDVQAFRGLQLPLPAVIGIASTDSLLSIVNKLIQRENRT
ncbi:MAG TPA: hypothetical protein VEH81_00200 [Ktedonobacteraceae bacterium]|nr:hypothetical protein [Ktedonobacteraceae bacterium]